MALHFKRSGQGTTPLLLIHGLFGSLENLGAIARQLGEHFDIYSIDLPNHGRSFHTETTGLHSMCEQVVQWMDEQRLEQVHVFGHSLGGKVGMELALQHPERVNQLIVVDIAPVHYPPHHDGVFAGLLSFDPRSIGSRAEADSLLLKYVEETPVRSFLLKNLVRSEQGGFEWRMNLSVIHANYEKMIQGNVSGKVFNGQTLFLKGGNSDYIQEKYRDEILARFPKATSKVIANTGHWLHAEKPEVVSKIALKFLQHDE